MAKGDEKLNWVAEMFRAFKAKLPKQRYRGKAQNIDLDKCVCEVDCGDDIVLYDVKLKAIEQGKDKGFYIVPKAGSYVTAAIVHNVEADMVLDNVSDVDSVAYYFGDGGKLLLTDKGEIYLNGDNYGPLIKIDELVSKINALEQKHNALVQKFNTHQHSGVFSGNSNTAVTTVISFDTIDQLTSKNDLKNDKVKHGG